MKQTRYLEIAKRLASLPKDKRQLFREKLAQQGINSWQLPIVPMSAESILTESKSTVQTTMSLSLAQQRFLVAEHMSTRALYNLCSVLRFDNGVNITALEQAVTSLIERHNVLRTRYVIDEKGLWRSEVMPTPYLSLAPITTQLINEATLENWYQEEYENQLAQPFDLAEELPLRVQLYHVILDEKGKTGDTDQSTYWMFFTIHHVAFDAWSSQQLNQELTLLYSQAIQHSQVLQNESDGAGIQASKLLMLSGLPELPIQYLDYARWQADWLEGDDYQRQRDYWKQQLAGVQKSLALPFDRAKKPSHERSYAGAVQGITLTSDFSASVRQRVNDTNSTLYIYFQTTFSWLLSTYSQQTDFCFGSSIANRSREELRPLVGPLLNTLVLRQRLDGNPSFAEALARTQTVTAGAFDHQDLPFEQLQELVKTEQGHSTEAAAPLFQVMFVHVALPQSQSVALPGTNVDIIDPKQSHSRFDLTLRVVEPSASDIRLELEYSSELFDLATIARLLDHLQQLLAQTLANPNTRLSEVTFASGLSRQLGDALATPAQLMNQAINRWCQPAENKRIALDTGDERISYAKLDTVVGVLAHKLQEKGIKKGDKVALFMPREARQIASLLACWRIGAIALMLDPRQPEQRLKALLADSAASLLLHTFTDTDVPHVGASPIDGMQSECLREITEGITSVSLGSWHELYALHNVLEKSVLENVASQDIAYILYTSGSTGKPKGVLISHGSVAHYSAAISQTIPSIDGGRWLTLATVAADLGLTSVLAALYQGQTLLLPDAELAFDPPALAAFLQQHPADYLKIVPSHLKGLLSVSTPIDILPKCALISGGEGMDEAFFNQLRSIAPDMAIINHYGPSETTVGVSYHPLNASLTTPVDEINVDEINASGISSVAPLGRALPESCLEIRSEQGAILPQGAAGELWISSPQLAQGYAVQGEKNPEQAQLNAVFVTEVSAQGKQRYYRSGDKVRLNNQGVFEYLGRLDDQIKRRGYRLELGEISGWLQVQAQVTLAHALVLQHKGRSLLIAAIEIAKEINDAQADKEAITAELLARMKAAMPDYMVPDQLICLDKMTLNRNGKIDRQQLVEQLNSLLDDLVLHSRKDPAQGAGINSTGQSKVEKEGWMNANETLLANLWCQLLGVEKVTLEDDFYTLGGDSILSLQLIGLARQQGAVLTPLDVMKNRTLAAMASCLPNDESSEMEASSQKESAQEGKESIQIELDARTLILRDLYREILGLDGLDHNANFYQAGGDSILSLQLIARARTAGVPLSPKLLAQHKTPQALVNALSEASSDSNNAAATEPENKLLLQPQATLQRVNRNQPHPLSEAQKRIWFMQQITPESSAWNVMQRLSIKGKLDLDALQRACYAIMQKHEILRTQFISQDDQVVQKILPFAQVKERAAEQIANQMVHQTASQIFSPFSLHQTTHAELEKQIQAKERRVFDLENGVLWSLDVFCLSETEYQLLINIHHIATDGWSMGLLVQEFLTYYSQAVAGNLAEEREGETLPAAYIDWVAGKHLAEPPLAKQDAEQTETYWLERLNAMSQSITLATDYAYPDLQTDRGARVEGIVPVELVKQIENKAQALKVTPFQLWFAAWKLLLWRYSGQNDFAIGVPVSGRDDPQTQNMVGVFINTMVCRSQIDGNLPLDEWLLQTANDTMADLNQPISLERLLECLQPERNMARPALFQTLFNYQVDSKGQRTIALPNLAIEAIQQTQISTKTELSLNLFRQDSLAVQLEYNRDIFSATTAEQIFADYQGILSQIVSSDCPALQRLHSLQLPSVQQDQGRGPESSIGREDEFIYRFEAQVEATPNARALHAVDRTLTYSELNHEANRLAHWLIAQGIKSTDKVEPLVALCLSRNSRLLIALLAIQKAGAAYVPLDPTQPKARLAMIAERSGAILCLCESTTMASLEGLSFVGLNNVSPNSVNPNHTGLKAVNLDLLKQELSQQSSANTGVIVAQQALAYTLYTSGSTGVPKGVQLERRQFANFLRAMERVFLEAKVASFNNVLALTTITFDIAGLELFLPLANGAAVILADEDARRDGEQIGRLILAQDIDLIQATPSGWRLLEGVPESALSKVTALAGGEALDSELAAQLKRQCRHLINVYGPTETTVWSSAYAVQNTSLPLTPIGVPLLNNHCYVLDAQLEPVPRGVVGELYIAGDGVARGYQGQPELTAERFLPDPFGDGGRLYRTGDLVKWLADGALYFVGRIDQQVKLRGFRIELSEIEAALLSHPMITQAAVTIEQERLIAWCVADSNLDSLLEIDSGLASLGETAALSEKVSNIQAHLALILPDYMLPQGYECLSKLPLNASGKVDRNALSKRGVSCSTVTSANTHSSAELVEEVLNTHEKIVSDIWGELLTLNNLSKHDHFFHLGGHSLMAAQVRSRMRAQGFDVSLRTLFETPILSDLAEHLSTLNLQDSVHTIPVVERRSKMPLSDAQRRLWFMQQLKQKDTSFNMSSVVELESALGSELDNAVRQGLDTAALQRALLAVAERHEILRITYHADADGEGYQTLNAELRPAFSIVEFALAGQELSATSVEELATEAIANAANTPFDLTCESPLRLTLYKLSEHRWLAQLVQHHIASDGWSMALLINDLLDAYQQEVEGKKANLTALPIQYLDYAAWQASPLVRAQQQVGLDYWRRHLVGMPAQLALPLDRPRTETAGDHGGAVDLLLPCVLTQSLNRLASEQGCSLFMLLLAAYTAQLHLETGSQDIVMGTDVANRDHGDTESLIGFFVNLMALRMKPNSMHTFGDYLQQVRQVCLDGFAYQDIPFDRVVEAVQPARIQGSHPLIQALLVMQNTPNASRELNGLQVTPRINEQQHSKFDMALFASEESTSQGEQLALRWVYRTALFESSTIERLGSDLLTLLERIVENLNVPLLSLKRSAVTKHLDESIMETKSPAKRKLSKLSKMKKTKTASSVSQPLVNVRPLNDNAPFPLLVECKEVGLDPKVWAEANQEQIMNWLEVHGGIVFRGFSLPTPVEFELFCEGIYPELYGQYGDLPKKEVGEKIYQSTPYPNDQMIMFHNESSHQHRWPRRQWFYCEIAAQSGGCTPIVDCRALYHSLPATVRQKLQQKQLKYVRNFSGLDVSWQHFFKTEDRSKVEAICHDGNIEFEWYGEDKLRISQICPAVIRHPITGEMSFFNQIQLHHYSFLEADIREHFLSVGGEENLPRNVYYGDGELLEQSIVDLISELYEAHAVRFAWRHGDVVMLDNMLAAHARDPFEGARKMAVAMGDIYQREQLEDLSADNVEGNNEAAASPTQIEEGVL